MTEEEIRKDERERCAKLAEEQKIKHGGYIDREESWWNDACDAVAEAIREVK